MIKVITYGTYDLLHYGHIRLLERAKALGDYLIVGVTADDFDKTRGKINVQQSLMERIEAVRATGLADEIVVEEYEGQKIDDIRRYGADIFTVGSDWTGKFDYLNEYCKVVYLDRTQGVSSTEIRSERRSLKIGLVGEKGYLEKFIRECRCVNGISICGVCLSECPSDPSEWKDIELVTDNLSALMAESDAVYITSKPSEHHTQIKAALEAGKHVLCESPIAVTKQQCEELFELAEKNSLVLMEALKTAYSTAYSRLVLLLKGGKIGKVVSVDATCTSLQDIPAMSAGEKAKLWNAIQAWGPTGLLPVFQILGTDYRKSEMVVKMFEGETYFDAFTKVNFTYDDAVASVKVGKGVKSEGELIVSGTEGYIYVPAPWWKTDYFEVRYENSAENKRYFYQLDGEGIRYEIVAFVKACETLRSNTYIDRDVSVSISEIMEQFENKDYISLG